MGGAAATLFVIFPAMALAASPRSLARTLQGPQGPPGGSTAPRLIPPPADAITSADVDQGGLRTIIAELVACGTRSSLSSWTDPKRGIGCGRERIRARLEAISKSTRGRLEVRVDGFQAASPRTGGQPLPLENVLALLPGSDPALRKTVFVVSGHYDSMPSNVMDGTSEAPGADDDASGTAVSIECARLLASRQPAAGYRATLIFAAVSGEEQGLLEGTRLLKYLQEAGYTVGGMLDDDIVGVRVFSGSGPDGIHSPSRELARRVEEIDSSRAVRLIFQVDRLGRGGDHLPFVEAGLPAVRFTEPLEDYHDEHQTPRLENGVQYGDLPQYLNFGFMAAVARDNAEALRELALVPAPPENVTLSGAVSPSAVVAWHAPDDPAAPASRSSGVRPPVLGGRFTASFRRRRRPPSRGSPRTITSSRCALWAGTERARWPCRQRGGAGRDHSRPPHPLRRLPPPTPRG